MIQVERFINELMTSNCYIVVDEASKHCICIDPASEKSLREIEYIESNGLSLDYIILTHEHTDHTWGVNALSERYPKSKIICSETCKQNLKKEFQAYFLFYYDNPDYHYTVCNVDITCEDLDWKLKWCNCDVIFIPTPGHSMGSVCIEINNMLFTGDAIMQTKPYINKRNGSKALFYESLNKVLNSYQPDITVFPGHGETFQIKDYPNN